MTKKALHIIYVPGIRDDKDRIQGWLVKTWRLYGVRGHCHEMPWAGPGAYEAKLQRLLQLIDDLTAQGNQVALIGASAGAGAVINAYLERRDKLVGIVYICGKINTPESVSDKTYRDNPAFKTSMLALQENLLKLTVADKSKILSLYSSGDHSVPRAATNIPGVQARRLPAFGHGASILYSLSFGARGTIKYLKQLAN